MYADLARRLGKLQSILDVAKAMSAERHPDRLLGLLVDEAANASVLAIEQRDPTTAGHSSRAAALTVGLARALEKAPPPAWRGVTFDAPAPERALDILRDEARRRQVDAPLLDLFVEAGVWRETVRR
jgi:hypothetical protein